MTINYTTETERGCGYRKSGGLYVCAGQPSMPCGKFPVPCAVCPTCHGGLKQSRSWTWFEPAPFFMDLPACSMAPRILGGAYRGPDDGEMNCPHCPVSDANVLLAAALRVRAGLLWIGETFYKTPSDFLNEGMAQGVSRRISALPNDFVVGQTRIFFAHPKAAPGYDDEIGEFADDGEQQGPGLFSSFVATSVEYILDDEERDSYELTEHCDTLDELAEEFPKPVVDRITRLRRMEDRGITLVAPTRVDGNGQVVDEKGKELPMTFDEIQKSMEAAAQ